MPAPGTAEAAALEAEAEAHGVPDSEDDVADDDFDDFDEFDAERGSTDRGPAKADPTEPDPAEARPGETRHGPAGAASAAARRGLATAQKRPRAGSGQRRWRPRAAGAKEGLEWLGRRPEARASLLYRLLRLVARFVLFGVLRFRIETSGQEHLPRSGGYLLIAGAHRGWMDPFVAMHALPAEPRCWFLGSGPSTFTSRWRERLIHRLGGLLPVWRGGLGVEGHVRSARAVVDAGAVFVQMPEGTVNGPAGRVGPFRPGAALIALRTGATIVPLAMAGTEELYIGRRMASQVLPPTSARELLGSGLGRRAARSRTPARSWSWRSEPARRSPRVGPVVEALHPRTIDPPDHPRAAPTADLAAAGARSAGALTTGATEDAPSIAMSGGTTWIAALRCWLGQEDDAGGDHRAAGGGRPRARLTARVSRRERRRNAATAVKHVRRTPVVLRLTTGARRGRMNHRLSCEEPTWIRPPQAAWQQRPRC